MILFQTVFFTVTGASLRGLSGWKWQYRFKHLEKHSLTANGCFDDLHDENNAAGCPCNNYNAVFKRLEKMNYIRIAWLSGGPVYQHRNSRSLLQVPYSYGR